VALVSWRVFGEAHVVPNLPHDLGISKQFSLSINEIYK
jgi:hypothetical protein